MGPSRAAGTDRDRGLHLAEVGRRGYTSGYIWVFSEFFGKTKAWEYLYYVLFIFFLIGLWVRRKDEKVFIVFFLVWMLLLVTWPSWQGPRFIFPLLPIFIYFVFQGMTSVIQKIPEKKQVWAQRTATAFWFVIIGIFLFQLSADAYKNLSRDRRVPNAFEPLSMDLYEFIRENTSPDSVIVFFKPRAIRMFTDRDAYVATTCSELTRGNYVVINKIAYWDILTNDSDPDNDNLIASVPGGILAPTNGTVSILPNG